MTNVNMKSSVLLLFIAFLINVVKGRVFYLQDLENNRNFDGVYTPPDEQSSRDLNLSFSAGDTDEGSQSDVIRPVKKMYTLVNPEKPFVEINRETDRPIAYYRLTEVPTRRYKPDDFIVTPEQNRKLVKINGNNKGEVILELRVIANHDGA